MAESLDPIRFPLYGERLIEASAGTGKTYTITGLYLRLLLGHGIQPSEENPTQATAFTHKLTVDQILVVTFTEAATQELKDRIRSRIKSARKAFEGYLSHQQLPEDSALAVLISETDDIKDAIATLRYAERQMDEAAIFTIHGFCMRMLKQHAFESGSLFNVTMCDDDREFKYQAAKDYWRQQFYPLPKALAQVVIECWSSPESLLSEIGSLLSDSALDFYQDYSIEDIVSAHERYVEQINEFKACLRDGLSALHDSVLADVQGKRLDGRSFSKKNVAKWVSNLERWVNEPTTGYFFPKDLEHFGKAKFESKAKDELTIDWSLAEKIQNYVDQPPELKPALKQHAIRACRTIYKQQKRKLGLLTFDDQITTMANALSDPETGRAFADTLRKQLPVAMVDEFQDTDQSQYRIFTQLYGGRQNTGLFMIGDPKQAIYAFRGGDIFTYMKARRNVVDHYTLDTNWRSSAAMVTAVNQVFRTAKSAFMYDQEIPFEAVNPSPKAKSMIWTINGERQPALRLWQPDTDELLTKDSDYLALMTDATANEVARLLTLSDQDQLHLCSGSGSSDRNTRLQPSDIAILVRNFGQAQRVRDALAERGIASVYSSDRSSVFEQQEAKVLLRILKAALLPERESLVKAAIGSDLFGWNVSQLNQLNENELAWERLVLQFKAFHHTWTRQGVLAALHELMNQQGIAVHLRKQVNGERRLTDFLHLCELLQNQSKSVESQYALVAWLEERIQQPNQNAQEQQLRLESEANQVKVVTYHKSKGLEYKIVFAPYVSYFWPNHRNGISISHDEQGNALVDVANKRLTEANQERIAEDIRLLYVTLTRSVYACYLGLPGLMAGTKTRPDPVVCPKYVSETGLGWLIGQGKKVLPDQLETVIQNWLTAVTDDMNTPAIKRTLPNTTYTEYQPADVHEDTLKLKTFNSSLDHNWWVTSYSRLVSGHHWVEEAADLIKDDIQIDQASNYDASVETKGEDALWLSGQTDQEQPVVELLDIDGSESVIKLEHTIHHFPKGAEAGTFLHTLFESIQYEDCESLETKEIVRELLMASPLSHQLIERELPGYRLIGKSELETEHLKAEVISRWVEVLHSMMVSVLSTPLHGGSQQGSEQTPVLAETQQAQRLVEMEFLIPMARIDCHKVNQIIRQDPLSSRATSGLGFAEVQGMLKGFIDLTFEYNGRFYVLDWKSNYLGPDSCDYTQSAMQQAMLEHRYDFQYQLYTLALHRYLKTRLPDYDYDRHIGGAYYVFLRGVDGSSSDNGIFYTKPSKTMIEALDQLFSGSSADQVIDNPQVTDKSEASKTESSQGIEVTTTMDTSSDGVSTYGDQGELF